MATSFMTGENPAETQGLAFQPSAGAADADTVVIGPMVGQMTEQALGG